MTKRHRQDSEGSERTPYTVVHVVTNSSKENNHQWSDTILAFGTTAFDWLHGCTL